VNIDGKVLLVSESLKGGHHRVGHPLVFQISTGGSSAVVYKNNGYGVSNRFHQQIKSLKGRPAAVLLGTDLDQQGTKVATVLRDYFENIYGGRTPIIRYALTAKGYAKVGRFYTQKEMQAFHALDRANIETARFYSKFLKTAFPMSLKSACVLAATAAIGRQRKTLKVKQGRTSTITAMTKGLYSGQTPKQTMAHLQGLYSAGLIDYPRVAADYDDSPLQVYAHPPLTAKGYNDDVVSPINAEELPLDKKSILLALSEAGLITPSMAATYWERIDACFDDQLKVKEKAYFVVKESVRIAASMGEEYASLLREISPNAPLEEVAPFPKPKGKKKEDEKEVESYLDALSKAVLQAYQKEKKLQEAKILEILKKQQKERGYARGKKDKDKNSENLLGGSDYPFDDDGGSTSFGSYRKRDAPSGPEL